MNSKECKVKKKVKLFSLLFSIPIKKAASFETAFTNLL